MSEELSPVEELAYPFLELAVKIDAAIQTGADRETVARLAADNAALWLYFKDVQVPTISIVSLDALSLVAQVTDFLIRVAEQARQEINQELLGRVVSINLNMCEVLLKSPETPTL